MLRRRLTVSFRENEIVMVHQLRVSLIISPSGVHRERARPSLVVAILTYTWLRKPTTKEFIDSYSNQINLARPRELENVRISRNRLTIARHTGTRNLAAVNSNRTIPHSLRKGHVLESITTIVHAFDS